MMADFSFLDNLSPEQSAIAEKIAQEAVKRGINPRFAVALAWTENKFTDKPGELDEIGIMQVRPGTAKQYGYNPKDLLNPDRNIQIGLDILRRHLDAFGRDPYAAAAAYNAGPGHPILTGKGDADLPESTKNYIRKIQSFGGFTEMPQEEPPAQAEKPPEITAPTGELKPMPAPERKPLMPPEDLNKTVESLSQPIKQDPLRAAFDVGAAATGAALAGGAKPAQMPAAPPMSAAPAGGPAGPVGGPATLNEQQAARILQGTDKGAGVTGRASQTGYNLVTAQQAAGTRESSALIDQLRRQGLVNQTSQSLLANAPPLSSTPSGVAVPRSVSTPDVPPRVGQPEPQRPSMTSRMSQGMGNINQRVAGIPTRAFGALGGLGVAEGAMEAKHRAETGDVPGAALASAGALGSLLSLFPPMRIVGAASTIASPLGMVLLDRLRGKPEDVMPLPAVYSRYQR
jgi:hypothetical protein